MPAVLTTYLVISSLPVVVEDEVGQSISYAPGAIFNALSNNPSIVGLLEDEKIIESLNTTPFQGTTVIEGPPGPTGSSAATGWEDLGDLVRLINPDDQLSAGAASPSVGDKFTIDAAAGGYNTGLLVINGYIRAPGAGVESERFGLGALAGGDCSIAVGKDASAAGTNSSAVGKGASATAGFGSAFGAASMAGLDGTALGSGAAADQGGTAVGRSSSAAGMRSVAVGLGAVNLFNDAVLVGPNGAVGGVETTAIGAGADAGAAGAQAHGFGASATGVDSSAWGRNATAAFSNSHAWGPGATTTASNQFVFGSQANPIGYYYFGRGEAATVAQDARLASTRIGTTQANEPGSNLVLVAGPGTGNAAPSRIFRPAATAGPSGTAQQVLATQMTVGEGVDITNWLNVGATALANSTGDIAASDGLTLLQWDAATPRLNIGVEGVVTRMRGIDAVSSGVDGGGLEVLGGTGLTTGAGGSALLRAGLSGASGPGGLAGVYGGNGITVGGAVEIFAGSATGSPGGVVTVRGGAGAPAGAVLVQGGITNGVGGQSADATLSGGDASPSSIALTGNAIVKGGDGLSNNNHGGHAFVRGGLAHGTGNHGYVQIDTAGAARWRFTNAGHFLAQTDNAFDIGAAGANRPRDLFVARNAVIDGNLTVNGTTTTIDSEIQTADNYILLNSEYTADTPQTGGLVINVDPAATSFSISDIASNVVTVVAGDPSAVLSPGDFVLIQNPANADNAGLFEVLSTTSSTITIDTTPAEAFTGTGLTDDATAQGTIVGTGVAVLRTTVTGDFERAFGTSGPLGFSPVAGDLATVLTIGNTTGGTDIVITSGDQITGGRANFGTTTDATADGDLSVGLVGDSRLSYTQSTGALESFFTNGESSAVQWVSAVVDFSVSGTATGLIPAGALPLGVTTYVLTPISGAGVTGYNVGDASDGDRWGAGLPLAATTQSDPTDYTDNTLSFNASASAADVILTGVGGTPTAGTVRVTLAYLSLTAPTS